MNWDVPFFDLQLGPEEKNAVLATLDSNWLTAGPRIAEFEAAFSAAVGGAPAVSLSSATAALHLALMALDIGPGDEVIVPSLTFVADANAVRYVGATPVLADVVSETDWNICPNDTESKITSKTKAIIVVHFAGYPCDMERFQAISKKHGIALIEDCSHCPVGTWKGRPLGTIGDIGCFSFFSNKNLTTGEGGMLVAKQSIVDRVKVLRSHGISTSTYQRFKGHAYGYDVSEMGYNYRLDEIRATLGLEQLKKLGRHNEMRRLRVLAYRRAIAERLPDVRVPFAHVEKESSWHIFPVLLPGDGERRNATMARMAEKKIQCSIHYRPIHTFTAYQNVPARVPITDKIAPSILTLPLFPTMTDGQMDRVLGALKECL